MRWGVFVFLVSVCSFSNSQTTEIALFNDLGYLTIELPQEFDRSKVQVRFSDCGCCCAQLSTVYYSSELQNYSPVDTINNCLHLEKGSLTYQFLVSQPKCTGCSDSDGMSVQEMLNNMRIKVRQEDLNAELIFDQLDFDDTRENAILVYRTGDGVNVNEVAEFYTILKGEAIHLIFQRINEKKTDFPEKMKDALLSVKFHIN